MLLIDYANAPTTDMPAAPIKTNVKAQIFIFLVMRSWASSERKSSARRSTVAAKMRSPDELARVSTIS